MLHLSDSFRSDIGLAVECGTRPIFFVEPHSLETFLPVEQQFAPKTENETDLGSGGGYCSRTPTGIKDDLRAVWIIVQGFSQWVNHKVDTDAKLSETWYLSMMITVMYRLLHMRFAPDSLSETIRLGLLAYSAHVFLQWHTCKARTQQLCSSYRGTLLAIDGQRKQDPQLILWLLFIGSVTVFTEADHAWLKPWLRSTLRTCKISRWSELKQTLSSFVWIGLLFDESARAMYESLGR
jgi:hypothetical protein